MGGWRKPLGSQGLPWHRGSPALCALALCSLASFPAALLLHTLAWVSGTACHAHAVRHPRITQAVPLLGDPSVFLNAKPLTILPGQGSARLLREAFILLLTRQSPC